MNVQFLPLQLLPMTFAAWINRRQSLVIDYLHEENRILREQLGNKKLRLTTWGNADFPSQAFKISIALRKTDRRITFAKE